MPNSFLKIILVGKSNLERVRVVILKISLPLIGVIITGLIVWVFLSEINEKSNKVEIEVKNLSDTIVQLQNSYNKFRTMSGSQLHDVWNQLFWSCEYLRDGKIREDQYDCATAETKFWRTLGANVVYESTEMKEARLKRVANPHKSIKTVRVGDIVIFKRTGKYGHISIVDRVRKTRIRVMDFNELDNGQGFETMKFNDLKIQNIYPMNFDYWCGDILMKHNGGVK